MFGNRVEPLVDECFGLYVSIEGHAQLDRPTLADLRGVIDVHCRCERKRADSILGEAFEVRPILPAYPTTKNTRRWRHENHSRHSAKRPEVGTTAYVLTSRRYLLREGISRTRSKRRRSPVRVSMRSKLWLTILIVALLLAPRRRLVSGKQRWLDDEGELFGPYRMMVAKDRRREARCNSRTPHPIFSGYR
jgi:hypothetical protein